MSPEPVYASPGYHWGAVQQVADQSPCARLVLATGIHSVKIRRAQGALLR